MRNYVTALMVLILCCSGCASESNLSTGKTADRPTVELLWPKGAPGAKGASEGDIPTLTIYLSPEGIATGSAVIICPGGGYQWLAVDHEGHQVAQWLNSLGIAGFILKYRHNGDGYRHPAPIQDAQRAIRTVRSRARDFSVDPNRIGICGFSAGGHLAATAGTHFKESYYKPKDAIDRVSPRPDFMILLYPVISMAKQATHRGSRWNLLGQSPDENLVRSLSNETQVTAETPPTFLLHADDDKTVRAENSIYFYLGLRKANVAAEMHIYEKGGHGFGLGKKQTPASSWPVRCADWMDGLGLCRKVK